MKPHILPIREVDGHLIAFIGSRPDTRARPDLDVHSEPPPGHARPLHGAPPREERPAAAVRSPTAGGKIVGALLTFGLVACLAALVASAVVWRFASNSGNPHLAGRGKTGVVVAAGAALLIGAATAIVTFLSNARATL